MTRTQARALARRARRYGYLDTAAGLRVTCPHCRRDVTTARGYRYWPARRGQPGTIVPGVNGGRPVVFRQETPAQALDRAMTAHLLTDCEPQPRPGQGQLSRSEATP